MTARVPTWAGYGALGLVAAAVFIPAFGADFVWDDSIIVSLRDQVGSFWDIWLNPSRIESEGHYWPVTYTFFWFEHLLWGLEPLGYHAVNVALHAANSMLAYALLRRLGMQAGAWLAAAVFAVHPTHVDSVVWAIERKDVLSALFYLLSAFAYVTWDERRRGTEDHRAASEARRRGSGGSQQYPGEGGGAARPGWLYWASVVLFALGLLSKSVVVTLPATLLVYHWWRNGRVGSGDLLRVLPHFAVAAAITVGDLLYYMARESAVVGLSAPERLQVVARTYWHYISQVGWPNDLAPIYPLWDIDSSDPLGWVLALVGVATLAGLWLARRRIGRAPLAAVLFFGLTLAPTSGIVDFGYMTTSYVADRFGYLAGLGLIALAAGVAAQLAERATARLRPTRRGGPKRPAPAADSSAGSDTAAPDTAAPDTAAPDTAAPDDIAAVGMPTAIRCVAAVALLSVLGALTWRGALNYRSPLAFFEHAVERTPDARGGAYTNLGNALRSEGRTDEAIVAYRRSLELDGHGAVLPLHALGVVYGEQDDVEQAASYYQMALEQDPSFVPALFNLADLRSKAGDLGAAERLMDRAVELDPTDALVLNGAALLAERRGDPAAAQNYFERGLQAHPDDEALLANYDSHLVKYVSHLVKTDQPAEAERLLRRALEANPKREGVAAELVAAAAAGYLAKGNDLLGEQRFTAAAAAYEAALSHDPELVAAHVQLAVAYENLDRLDDALSSYQRAYDLDSENISAVYFLALLSARGEQWDRARTLFDEAELLLSGPQAPINLTEAELPTLADVLVNRAVVLVNLGLLDEALAGVERSLELEPGNELAVFNREQILGMIGQRDRGGA